MPLADTPWDEPTSNSPEFTAFLSGEIYAHDPWRRLGSPRSSAVAQMLLAMLTVDPEKRPRLKDVERMDWYLQCVQREPLRSSRTPSSNPVIDYAVSLRTGPIRCSIPQQASSPTRTS